MNKLQLFLKNNKTLSFALLISLLFHLIVLSQFLIKLPAPKNLRNTFDVQLISGHPDKQTVMQSSSTENNTIIQKLRLDHQIVEVPIKDSTTKPLPKPTEELSSTKAEKPEVEPSIEQPSVTEPTETALTEPPVQSSQETPQSISNSQTEAQNPPPRDTQTKAQSMPSFPAGLSQINNETPQNIITQNSNLTTGTKSFKQIETEFEVYQSTEPSTLSINRVLFSTQGKKFINQTYEITQSLNSLSTSTALSQGRVSQYGLKPSYYLANGQYANFSWSDGVVDINNKYEKLPKDTQDEISYMYQFMFAPPLKSNDIVLTNGKQLLTYQFINLGEELLQTKMGELKTTHLFKDGEDKIDLWLAVDYQFIPVKFRRTAKDGTFTEETAIKLSTTLNETESQ